MKVFFKTYPGTWRYITIYEDSNWIITWNDPWYIPGSFKFYYGKGNYSTCVSWLGITIYRDKGILD